MVGRESVCHTVWGNKGMKESEGSFVGEGNEESGGSLLFNSTVLSANTWTISQQRRRIWRSSHPYHFSSPSVRLRETGAIVYSHICAGYLHSVAGPDNGCMDESLIAAPLSVSPAG